MRETTDDLTDAGREVLSNIAEHKVHVVHVAGDGDGPAFSYTVGLWHHFRQPEVLVLGLEADDADELLHTVADECGEGRRFHGGEKHDGLLVGFAVRFLAVPDDVAAERLGAARWAYQDEPFSCVQLVWPDKNRKWPWEEGARQVVRDAQPLLGTHP